MLSTHFQGQTYGNEGSRGRTLSRVSYVLFKEEAPFVLRNTLRAARLKETLASCMWTLLISIQSVSTRNFHGRFAVPSGEGDNFYRVPFYRVR